MCRFFAILSLFWFVSLASADILRVALYPYVPNIKIFEKELQEQWKALGETHIIEFVKWDCYMQEWDSSIDIAVSEGTFFRGYLSKKLLAPIPLEKKELDAFYPFCQKEFENNGVNYGIPQMLCTNFLFVRPGDEALLQKLELGKYAETLGSIDDNVLQPPPGKGLLFSLYSFATIGLNYRQILHYLLEENHPKPIQLADAILLDFVRATGTKQAAYYPEDNNQFVRAEWFSAGHGRAYIDYSEGLSHTGKLADRILFRPLLPKRTPYFVNPVCISAACPEKRQVIARRLVRLMTSREYLSACLWPKGENPQYLLPTRKDVLTEFASRNRNYKKFQEFVEQAGNYTFTMPENAMEIYNREGKEQSDRCKLGLKW
ncbi:MAG: thiamine pyridinylase [Victivallales bacterium]|nr:thiamine pyridinylase [Victivallales bacterium]